MYFWSQPNRQLSLGGCSIASASAAWAKMPRFRFFCQYESPATLSVSAFVELMDFYSLSGHSSCTQPALRLSIRFCRMTVSIILSCGD